MPIFRALSIILFASDHTKIKPADRLTTEDNEFYNLLLLYNVSTYQKYILYLQELENLLPISS